MLLLQIALAIVGSLTGPEDLRTYPPAENSPYVLPWDSGVVRFCIQGNRGIASHHPGDGIHAWDFVMPVGSKVRAARGGRVTTVIDHHDGRGNRMPNNRIVVDHGDGTHASYLHLRKGGARVAVGESVKQGAILGESGNVGRSLLPHLHFQVAREGQTIPVTFRDSSVTHHQGVPRMGALYRSEH